MAVTHQELEQFHQYAQSKLGQPQPPETLQECLNEWRQDREEAAVVNDLQQALADIEAGAGVSLADAETRLRQDLHWYGPGT